MSKQVIMPMYVYAPDGTDVTPFTLFSTDGMGEYGYVCLGKVEVTFTLPEISPSPRGDMVAVYAAPQPAEQQPSPDAEGLVDALEEAYGTLERAVSPADETPEAAIQSAMFVIDAALAAYRKGGCK